VAELERHRSGRIFVLDERLRRRAVSGVFPLDDPAAATDILEATLDVRVSRLPWLTLIY